MGTIRCANQQTGRQHLSGDQSAEYAKHTPTPWLLDRGDVTDTSGNIIAWVSSADDFTTNCDDPHPETTANARLIAAAPEMYEALRKNVATMQEQCMRLASFGRSHFELDAAIEQTNAILAKAEGRDR